MKVGAFDDVSKKGSLSSTEVDVPDLNTGELSIASLIVVKDIEENASSDPAHPFSAYLIGTARIVPRYGSVYSKDDSLSIFYQYYDARVDAQTGKASAVSSLSITKKDGRPVAKAADMPFELAVGGTVVGPVPLAGYEPGAYVIRLKVIDNLAKKDATKELAFEIK